MEKIRLRTEANLSYQNKGTNRKERLTEVERENNGQGDERPHRLVNLSQLKSSPACSDNIYPHSHKIYPLSHNIYHHSGRRHGPSQH